MVLAIVIAEIVYVFGINRTSDKVLEQRCSYGGRSLNDPMVPQKRFFRSYWKQFTSDYPTTAYSKSLLTVPKI
jgi:hypothetical protein